MPDFALPTSRPAEKSPAIPGGYARVYGLRHSLLWPGQFAMMDLFKFITAWCLIVSLLAWIVYLFGRQYIPAAGRDPVLITLRR